MDIEVLLAAIAPDSPCGPALEYDPDFLALDQAARGKPEQQFGTTIVPAEEPDWVDVRKRAEALFLRTKDLRVAVLLLRALAKTAHFVGLAEGLSLLHELLLRFWDGVHPALDPEDGNDPTMRLNALAQLADAESFIRDLRLICLVGPGRHGRLSVRDILVLAGKLPAGSEAVPTQNEMEGMLRASAAESAAQVDGARQSLRAVGSLQSLLAEKVGIDRVPDLQPLRDILKSVVQVCDTVLGTGEEAAEGEGEGDTMTDEGGAPGKKAAGELRTREDVLRLLDRICDFIQRSEPSSPAPLLIRRAQRLMNMNFVEILEDIAPDGVTQARNITGMEKK
jgi:type VI secretion system protein ImpA